MNKYINQTDLLLHSIVIDGHRVVPWVDILAIPGAEVVEVVRCKDCKHYMTIHCTCDGCCISDDWYCADGERKEV